MSNCKPSRARAPRASSSRRACARVVGLFAVVGVVACSGAGDDASNVATTESPLTTGGSVGAITPTAPLSLRPRVPAVKTTASAIARGARNDQIIVKFVEGSRVRLSAGRLTLDATQITTQEEARLQRVGHTKASVQAALPRVRALLADPAIFVAKLFPRPDADLDAERGAGETAIGEELADLNLYHTIDVPLAQAPRILAALNADDLVEVAYFTPIAALANADIPPTTPSYVLANSTLDTPGQGYLTAAPGGVDATYAWSVSGATGAGIRIIDVEGEWNFSHEDLPTSFVNLGTPTNSQEWKDHGTAVLGEMVAQNGSYGITGIAYGSTFGTSSAFDPTGAYVSPVAQGSQIATVPPALNAAAARLRAGDVINIELHYPGPSSGLTCPCNCSQFEFIPVEYWQADFDAIKSATAKGINVAEAAGNGSMNLDSSIYGNDFKRATRDSGAILVGAGMYAGTPSVSGLPRQPECFSNYGSRVDAQGWGDNIESLGYGNIIPPGAPQSDQNQWYTFNFSGTSGATPMVAAAATDIEGSRVASGLAVLTPAQVRSLLVSTGTAEPAGFGNIGPLPNLRAALSPKQPPAVGSIAALRQSANVTSIFAVGADGALYRRWVSGTGAWQGPTAMTSTGFAPPGAGVAAALQTTTQADVFVVGNDGEIYYFTETNDGTWSGPTITVSALAFPPGAQLATGLQAGSQFDVLAIDGNGAVNGVWWNNGISTAWTSLPSGIVVASNFGPPGGALAIGNQGTNVIDVFGVGTDGALKYTTATGLFAWTAPANISPTSTAPPGAPVATAMQSPLQLDVFVVGNNGIMQAGLALGTGAPGYFGNLHSTALFSPGARVSASAQGTTELDVFAVGSSGAVEELSVLGNQPWSAPVQISGTTPSAGAATAAATQSSTRLDLFAIGDVGITLATATTGNFSTFSKLAVP